MSETATYIGLLRGINVSASTRVAMAELRGVFEDAGYSGVKTLLQSGNVVFDSPTPLPEGATAVVERAFAERTGLAARVILIEGAEFIRVVELNPLTGLADDGSRLFISFLPEPLDAAALELPDEHALLPEVIGLGDRAVYAWCPFGLTGSRIPASFWRQLGPAATMRNANTAGKLVSLVRERTRA